MSHPFDANPPHATDLGALLRVTVAEAASLLPASGGMIYLLDADGRFLRLAYDEGVTGRPALGWAQGLRLPMGAGLYGWAVATGETHVTGDYAEDQRFHHSPEADRVVAAVGIRSMIVAPLSGDRGPLGALGVFSGARDAFSSADVALIRALANHAGLAIANARLIEELDRSMAEIAQRAEGERSLREIAGELARIRDPGLLLQRVVDEAGRLVRADGSILALLGDDGVLHWGHDDGVRRMFDPAYVAELTLEIGVGVTGRAVAERRAVISNEGLIDAFPRSPESDHFFEVSGFRAMIAAPIIGEAGPLGALEVYARREHAFAESDAALISAFADEAAIALANARLIHELARSREEARDLEARYRYLVKASPDVVWAVDDVGRFTFLSDRIEPLVGFRPDELLGRHFEVLTDPSSMPAALAVLELVQADPGGVHPLPILMTRREGPPIPVEVWVTGIVRDGQFAGAHGSIRDMRERQRLERELLNQATELAASRERAHLARELHDSVTQALFSMTLVSRSIELLLDRDPAAVAGKLAVLRELQGDALAEMRALIFELRPASLETAGLVAALRTHAAAVAGRTGLAVVIDAPELERPPADVEAALFRIAQEALHNVVKHAGATAVRVSVDRVAGHMAVAVEDDGAGFDPDAVPGDTHLGLAGMRARAEKLGGRLVVRSAPGRGTRIEAQVPLGS